MIGNCLLFDFWLGDVQLVVDWLAGELWTMSCFSPGGTLVLVLLPDEAINLAMR